MPLPTKLTLVSDRGKQVNKVLRQGQYRGKLDAREGRRAAQEGTGPIPMLSPEGRLLRKERRTFQETTVSNGRKAKGPCAGGRSKQLGKNRILDGA